MNQRLYDYINITDLKDMLNKSNKLYANNIAYKIREEQGKYKTFTYTEVMNMINAIRHSTYRHGIKR